ncbi:acyltransferase family protein [Bradyrhizobium sp. HKCCYLRH3099]|uniref:acyltransferase family protein n=1 Tax=unclassified Bradyrhizobium TaxID=2631580 RepID=UPI003EBDFFB5
MTEEYREGGRRLAYLDGLRGVAAFVVLIGHSWQMFSQPISSYQANDGISALPAVLLKIIGLLANSNSAVCIFFLLSGYVLADFAQATKLSLPAQIVRRYLRLAVPILITSTLAYVLLRWGLFRNAESARIFGEWAGMWYRFDPSFQAMAYEALVGTFTSGSNTYNPNLWTMHPEILGSCYVLLINPVAQSRRWRAALYACVIAVYLWDYLPLFVIGAFLREYDPIVQRLSRLPWIPAALCTVGFYFCTLPDSPPGGKLQVLYPILSFSYDNGRIGHSIGAVLLLTGVAASQRAQRSLASRPARWLGNISFTLYLIHVPILCSFGAWLIVTLAPQGSTFAAAIGLPLTLTLCLAASAALTPWVDGGAVTLSRQVGRRLDDAMRDPASPNARVAPAVR